jgi:TonB-dependent receptor
MKNILLTLSFISISLGFFSQFGVLSGVVANKTTGDKIEMARIKIEGINKGGFTDSTGSFSIQGIKPGTYIITCNVDEMGSDTLRNVVINANATTTIDFQFKSSIKTLQDFKISVEKNKETVNETEKMKQKNASVIEIIGKETFNKSPNSNAAEIFKRVSGASVQDNKFVVVRGLSDRYNFALINGAALPSSESDRKAFSFDLFPANMIDNLMITKSATPDLPGEFAGGVININTTEPKSKNFQNIQITSAYNTLSTFKNFKTYDGSSTDFLGYGTSARSIPDGLPSTEVFNALSNQEKADYAKMINTSWGTKNRLALPNFNLQYSIGRSFKIKYSNTLGYVLDYSYQNNFSANQVIRREFEEQATGVITKNELLDSAYTQSIVNSAMANFKYTYGYKNTIQFKNLYTVNSDDKVNIRNGKRDMDIESVYNEKSTNIWYTQSNLITSQLIGSHESRSKYKFNWVAGFSNVKRDIPFLRRTVYQQVDTTLPYFAVVQNNDISTLGAGNMFWSTLTENNFNAKYDVAKLFEIGKSKNEVKIGGMHQYRTRSFSARNLGFSKYDPTGSANFNSSLLLLPGDEIFNAENLGLMADGQGGFKLEEGTNVDDSYQASSFLNSAFAMVDSKLSEQLRIIAGARFEAYNQVFKYVEFGSNLPQNIDTTVLDILPSINLVYSPIKKINFRLSASQTVSRPEFRELAPFAFYNFLNDNLTSGDPKLQRAKINNFDFRTEYFPGKGQVISISGFYKQFFNPIELLLRTGTSGTPELYYDNVGNVESYGAELEYRMNLGFIQPADTGSFWKNFTIYTNAALIKSKMDLSSFAGQAEYVDRPLQGQSPYLVNAGLYFTEPKTQISFNASYNVVGQRIAIAGSVQEPSVWENRRHVIDLQLVKNFGDKFELKLNVKDLLAQDLTFFQDINKNKKYDADLDNTWQQINFGQTISLSLKYNF